jgi:hypothetical protein
MLKDDPSIKQLENQISSIENVVQMEDKELNAMSSV